MNRYLLLTFVLAAMGCGDAPRSGEAPLGGVDGGTHWGAQDECQRALGLPCSRFEEAYLKASNSESEDRFGYSVALSRDGNTLAVGAYGEASRASGVDGEQSDNSIPYTGAVYLFVRGGATWTQQAYLKPSNPGVSYGFGYDVALSADGDTLAVGALAESSSATGVNGNQADNSAPNSGAVYVFKRNSVTWRQQAYLKPSTIDAVDNFGGSVALSADGLTLAVSSVGEDSGASGINGDQTDNSAPISGAVYVFVWRDIVWTQEAYFKASNPDADDRFGLGLALSGDGRTLAVGAPLEDSNGNQADNSAPDSGAVYLFSRAGPNWYRQAYLKASNNQPGMGFGYSLSLSRDGNTLAVGAPGDGADAARMNGDRLAEGSGAVFVFGRSGIAWTEQAYLKALHIERDDFFGIQVRLSQDGTTLVASAHEEDGGATGINGDQADNDRSCSGAVYLFKRRDTWTQTAYIKASNTGSYDTYGWSMALSHDGTTLAVGADSEDSAATGVNGDQANNSADSSGAVYVRRIAP